MSMTYLKFAAPLAVLFLVLSVSEAAFESDEVEWETEEVPLPLPKQVVAESAWTKADSSSVSNGGVAAGRPSPEVADATVTFALEHSLDGRAFTKAGDFSAKLRTVAGQSVPKLTRVRLTRSPWSLAERSAFTDLIARRGYYRLRVPSSVFSPGAPPYTVTAVLAACLADAHFNEHFDFHVDSAGHVVALGYKTFVDCTTVSGQAPREWTFSSTASVRSALTAPRLASTVSSLDVLKPPKPVKVPSRVEGGAGVKEGDASAAEEEETEEEEKTFFQKYWLYMIPVGLLLLNMMAAAAPEEASQGAARR